MTNRKEIGLSVPYRKTTQTTAEAKIAALEQKVAVLEKRIAQLEKK
jgi:uncharacterized protein YceH (UPF0502 family)